MSKNIAILEGTSAVRFRNVKKIQIHNIDGGTDYWVPESETKLGTKHISKNGTYIASEEKDEDTNKNKGWYGYERVTVSGIGKATGTANEGDRINGIDLDEDDEVTVSSDENGKLKVTLAPIGIGFERLPLRLKYYDGDEINLAGSLVRAYVKGNNPWEGDEQHQNGYIPYNELVLQPSVADISVVSEKTATSDLDTGVWEQPIPLYTKFWIKRIWQGQEIFDHAVSRTVNNAVILISEIIYNHVTLTYVVPELTGEYGDYNTYTAVTVDWDGNVGQGVRNDLWKKITINDKDVYAYYTGWGAYNYRYSSWYPEVPTRGYPNDNACWTAIWGDIHGGKQGIIAKWARPGDDKKVLATTFEIEVTEKPEEPLHGGGHDSEL